MMKKISKHQHYWLVAGKVKFHMKDDEQKIGESEHNTLVLTDSKFFNEKSIAEAQHGLQMSFEKKIPMEIVSVVDVFILSVSHLGHMNQGEFTAGMEELRAKHMLGEIQKRAAQTPPGAEPGPEGVQ